MTENPNSIGQIRELIFGETISQIEQRFNALEKKIASLEQSASESEKKIKGLESRTAEMEAKIEKMVSNSTNTLRKELHAIRDSLNQRIDTLASSATNRVDLGEWFGEISARLNNTQRD